MHSSFAATKPSLQFPYFLRSTTVAFAALFVSLSFVSALPAQSFGTSLNIDVLQGENAQNNVGEATAHEPIVQVSDEHHKPLRGAAVSFAAMAGPEGAGAGFGAQSTYTTVTDAEGKAVARGFEPNQIAGDYKVQVIATKGAQSATTTIHERNVTAAAVVADGVGVGVGSGGGFLPSAVPNVLLAGAASTGAVAGLYQAFSGNDVKPASPVTSIPATPASVPEIDPSMAFGCLVLLAGSAAVLRAR